MIIALSGKKRAGKDTVAGYLVRDYGFTRVAFADPLKDVLYGLNPTLATNRRHASLSSLVDTFGWEALKDNAEWGTETRVLLQRLGESVRAKDPVFWVNQAVSSVCAIRDAGGHAVVTDARYPNEIDALRDIGAAIVRVARSQTLPAESLLDTHVSETLLDDMGLLRPDVVFDTDPFDSLPSRMSGLVESVLFRPTF